MITFSPFFSLLFFYLTISDLIEVIITKYCVLNWQDISWARRAWWMLPCCLQLRGRASMRWGSLCPRSRARLRSFSRSCCGWRCEHMWIHKRAAQKNRWIIGQHIRISIRNLFYWTDDCVLQFNMILFKFTFTLFLSIFFISGGRLVDEDFRELHSEWKVMRTWHAAETEVIWTHGLNK